jgi:hypothetical protein
MFGWLSQSLAEILFPRVMQRSIHFSVDKHVSGLASQAQ